MNFRNMLKEACADTRKHALPVLSFPASQKLGVTVKDIVQNAELQAQAMALIARETDTLAAVSPMDLSVEAEAFGAKIRFSRDEVPTVVGSIVEGEDDVEALELPATDAKRCRVYADAVRIAKTLIPDKPVLAGMIGPYSLAGRLMDVSEIMCACLEEPETVTALMEKVTNFLIAYGKTLRAAGADGIVMAEPLAGIISPAMMEEFSMPYVKRFIAELQDAEFGVVYHNCGNSVMRMLDGIFAQGAAAYHFGNAADMAEVMRRAPKDAICLGNINPATEFAHGTPESIRARTRELLESCGSYPNCIPSSGCDIPGQTPWENIEAFFDTVRNYKA